MDKLVSALADTPIPTILVIAGILFMLLSVADKVVGEIAIPEKRKKKALIVGAVMLIGGIGLSLEPQLRPTPALAPALATDANPKWETVAWSALTEDQRAYWEVLVWTAQRWGAGPDPATEGTAFADLTGAEKAAMTALGFTAASWDAR